MFREHRKVFLLFSDILYAPFFSHLLIAFAESRRIVLRIIPPVDISGFLWYFIYR